MNILLCVAYPVLLEADQVSKANDVNQLYTLQTGHRSGR